MLQNINNFEQTVFINGYISKTRFVSVCLIQILPLFAGNVFHLMLANSLKMLKINDVKKLEILF